MSSEEDSRIPEDVLESLWTTPCTDHERNPETGCDGEENGANEVTTSFGRVGFNGSSVLEHDETEAGETFLLCAEVKREFPDSMDVFQSGAVSGGLLDIAERLSQSAMQRTKIFFLLSENSSDPHFVKDLSLRYVYVNRAMEKMLGRKRADILGLSDTTLYGREASVQLVEATGKALNGSTVRMKSLRRIGKEERLFFDTLIPWKDHFGNTTGVCGSHVDITDGGDRFDFESLTDEEPGSEAMKQTFEQALIVARTNSSVLLLGESGSGKDFLARFIHDHSDRSTAPFRSVNCAALPSELVESELFGHEKGAFSGAASNKRGHVELAHRGTLLLNEIGELPLALQSKLLTFLDNRIFTRVGGEREIKADVRLIAATNRVLEREVQAGNFREDLFYRLNVFSIRVPPLRQRKADLPVLVK
jgi:PAS domain S-box-containing protein